MPRQIASMEDYDRWIDGYDCGVRFADDHLSQLIDVLSTQGVLEDTAIVITADHGENLGELNHYGSHRTGDAITHRIPMIMRWPGVTDGGPVIDGLHYHFDAAATILELLGIEQPPSWHAQSFVPALRGEASSPRDHVVLGQLACMAQRSVRFDRWLLARTWHDGFTGFPPVMLFDLKADPHELHNVAAEYPDIVKRGLQLLEEWQAAHVADQGDPLQTVLREGPHHANAQEWAKYAPRLRATGRGAQADEMEARAFLTPAYDGAKP
jgi:arylsulfatase A-like enzyme